MTLKSFIATIFVFSQCCSLGWSSDLAYEKHDQTDARARGHSYLFAGLPSDIWLEINKNIPHASILTRIMITQKEAAEKLQDTPYNGSVKRLYRSFYSSKSFAFFDDSKPSVFSDRS